MINANDHIGSSHVLFVTLDTLRYDVAQELHHRGETPILSSLLGPEGWEERHSPASFTFAAHQAFFAGFLPTPVAPGKHPRLFAARFAGSETSTGRTCVFDTPDIITGLAQRGYRTICVGGVGFFNKQTALGSVLPSLFQESYWSPELGVTHPRSTEAQVHTALQALSAHPQAQKIALFLNVSALHQPNRHYLPGATSDTVQSHGAALRYVDSALQPLFEAMRQRGTTLCVLCADHGTAYGEDGYHGHRIGHPSVWTVPYTEHVLTPTPIPDTP